MQARWAAVIALLLVAAGAAQAQYRWRDASGQTNYGDFPPADARDLQRVNASASSLPGDGGANLPFELRRAMAQHPVVLYTSADCPACDNGRTFLRQRGVPFGERTVEAPEDVETLKQLTGLDKVPVLMLGRERFAGFNAANWTRALDFAGYPAESKLPNDFRLEPPQPLVARASGPANTVGPAAGAR